MDTSGSLWPFNNADTIRKSGQYCNGALLQSSVNQHWVYNKGVLQQTMLKHQAIFRNQIHELHRLYWRQRELMDEMKQNKLENHHLNLQTLQSNPHLSQKSSDFAEKNCNVLTLPQGNPACSQLLFSTAESSLLLSSFCEGKSTHADFDLAETKFSLKDCQLESKCKKFGKKILNVELPADKYVDGEEEKLIEIVSEVSGRPEGRIPEVHMSDQQTYHGNASFNSVLGKDCLTHDTMFFTKNCLIDLNEPLKLEIEVDSSVLKKGFLTPDIISFRNNCFTDLNEPLKLEKEADHMSTYLVDLNQPINLKEEATRMSKFVVDLNEPIKLQEEVASRSSDITSLSIGDKELPNQDLSKKSNSGLQVMPTDVMQNTNLRWDLKTCSDGLQLEKNKMLEWPSSDHEAGQSRIKAASVSSSFTEEVSKPFEDVKLKQSHELRACFLMDQSKKKCDPEGLQSLERELSPNSHPEWASCQLISLTDVGNSETSLVSNWRKYSHDFLRTPIAFQALPCFTGSEPLSRSSRSLITSLGLTGNKSDCSENLKSCPKFDGTRFHQHSYGSHSALKTSESAPPSIDCNGMDCSNNVDLTSQQHGPVRIIKSSVDVTPANDMDYNFISYSCTSDGEKKIEDSTEWLPWLKKNSVHKGKHCKRSELSTQMESILLKANSASIFDVVELKKVEASNNSSIKRLLGGEQLTSIQLVVGIGLIKIFLVLELALT